MFYPAPSLRRGGRFHACWLVQAWPRRFNAIYNRRSRLFSINIAEICDDLIEVIASESGSVVRRFSLRLSSKLVFGIIRIYQRQANVFLEELCKTGGAIIDFHKKQKAAQEGARGRARVRAEEESSSEDDEEDPRREEVRRRTRAAAERGTPRLVQALPSSITLREEVLRHNLEPTIAQNDGFGETAADVTQQLETMLGAEGMRSVEASLACGHRRSNPTPATVPPELLRTEHMEVEPAELMSHLKPFSETALRGDADVSNPELQAEAPVPPPTSPVRPAQALQEPTAPPAPPAPEPILEELSPLEELAEEPPGAARARARRRRRRRGLIVDRVVKKTIEELKQQYDVRAQCRDGKDMISLPRQAPVSAEDLLHRSARGWSRSEPTVSPSLVGMFVRNCFVLERRVHPLPMPDVRHAGPPADNVTAPNETRVLHESTLVPPRHASVLAAPESPPVPLGHSTPAVFVMPQVVVQEAELTLGTAEDRKTEDPSRKAYVKLRRLDFNTTNITDIPQTNGAVTADLEVNGIATAAEERDVTGAKDRDSAGAQKRDSAGAQKTDSTGAQDRGSTRAKDRDSAGAQKRDSTGAQDGGSTRAKDRDIAGVQKRDSTGAQKTDSSGAQDGGSTRAKDRDSAGAQKRDSTKDRDSAVARDRDGVGAHDRTNGSEPQLGSLDRTPVFLSESETDSHKTMKDTWGPRATLLRVIGYYRKKGSGPLTMDGLMELGPASPPGKKRMMVACCFSSLLKLKSNGFLALVTDPLTSQLVGIQLGQLIND